MPFETKYQREDIINAAFKIAEKDGFDAISARTVAKSIKGSVAPIYFNFKNIEELIDAVVSKVFKITEDILKSQQSGNLYEDIGRAGFEFADRYPVFFRELALKPNPYMATYETTEASMLHWLDQDPVLKTWSIEERRMLILKMKVLQTGVATLVATQNIPSWITKKDFQELLIELGSDLRDLENDKRKKL